MKKIKEFSGHSGPVYDVDFDGKFLYSTSSDCYVVRWDLALGIQDHFAIKMDKSAYAISCLNEKLLAVGDLEGKLFIFDCVKKIELKQYVQHEKPIFAINTNPIKSQFYVADTEGNLSIWDLNTLDLIAYLPFDCGKVRGITVSDNGNHILLCSQDGMIRMINTETLNEELNFLSHESGANCAILEDNRIISGGKNARIREWSLNGERLNSIDAHNYAIYDMIKLKEGEIIVTASFDKSIKLWTKELNVIEKITLKEGGHKSSINSLVKINEQQFASCSDDKKIIVWEV